MSYKNRLIRIILDDFGDGCFVEVKSPMLVTQAELDPGFDITVDGVVDNDKADEAGRIVMARLITQWCVWDVNDDSDDPAVLPLPSEDPTVWDRIPAGVIQRVGAEINSSRPAD